MKVSPLIMKVFGSKPFFKKVWRLQGRALLIIKLNTYLNVILLQKGVWMIGLL